MDGTGITGTGTAIASVTAVDSLTAEPRITQHTNALWAEGSG